MTTDTKTKYTRDMFDEGILLEPETYDRALVGKDKEKGWPMYDADIVMDVLINDEGMPEEDAADWFSFNIVGLELNGFVLVYNDLDEELED